MLNHRLSGHLQPITAATEKILTHLLSSVNCENNARRSPPLTERWPLDHTVVENSRVGAAGGVYTRAYRYSWFCNLSCFTSRENS